MYVEIEFKDCNYVFTFCNSALCSCSVQISAFSVLSISYNNYTVYIIELELLFDIFV